FQNPPPDLDLDQAAPEQHPVPPVAPDVNMTAPPGNNTSDLLDLGDDGPPAPTTVPDVAPPEATRRSGYAEGGPLPNLGNQEQWNPASLRQLDPSDLEPDSYDWIDVSLPLPRTMQEHGPWSNREGWKIRVCSHFPLSPSTIRRPSYWPFPDLFCIRPADHPSWLERQMPPQPVAHLPV
ncbi:U2SURP, partial [Symbiodinium sp. CCMP2456]